MRALALVSMMLGVAGPAAARWDVHFLPSVSASAQKTENVNVTGDAKQSDIISGLSVRLAVEADRPTTTFRFAYLPQRQTFQDFGNFDNTAHRVQMGLTHQGPTGAGYTFTLNASRTQQQGIDPEDAGNTLTLVPRTTLQRADLTWGANTPVSVKSSLTWGFRAGVTRFEDRSDVDFEDSNQGGVSLGWSRSLSVRSAFTLGYSFQTIDFETLESTESHALNLGFNRQLGRYLSGSASVGTAFTEVGSEAFSDPVVQLTLSRSGATAWSVQAGVRQAVSSGAGDGGATLDRTVFAGYRKSSRAGRLGVDLNVSYAQREGFDIGTGEPQEFETLLTRESFNWRVHRSISLGIFHQYANQDRLAGATPGTTSTDFHSGGINLAWARQRRP